MKLGNKKDMVENFFDFQPYLFFAKACKFVAL